MKADKVPCKVTKIDRNASAKHSRKIIFDLTCMGADGETREEYIMEKYATEHFGQSVLSIDRYKEKHN